MGDSFQECETQAAHRRYRRVGCPGEGKCQIRVKPQYLCDHGRVEFCIAIKVLVDQQGLSLSFFVAVSCR